MVARLLLVALLTVPSWGTDPTKTERLHFIKAYASTKEQRTAIAEAGMAMDGILSDSVIIYGTETDALRLQTLGIRYEISDLPRRERDFPPADGAFHDYRRTLIALNTLEVSRPQIVTRISLGKSVEGRELAGVRISESSVQDSLPTVIFLGCHHAREHLSVEVPLMLAEHLVKGFDTDRRIHDLLTKTEVWIVPMLNPDGAEYDIATGRYRYWRKNRKSNGDGTYGVDLNRNYGAFWGGAGSSGRTTSEVYRGASAFSEPETQAVRDFVSARKKATILLTFHTYGELILWPWGYTDQPLSDPTHRKVFETMGKQMAQWNHYKPEKGSELYLTTGDTTDWAYKEFKIFAFTFEMSPSSETLGGFYPGASAIQRSFRANLEPALYLIEHAPNPVAVIGDESR